MLLPQEGSPHPACLLAYQSLSQPLTFKTFDHLPLLNSLQPHIPQTYSFMADQFFLVQSPPPPPPPPPPLLPVYLNQPPASEVAAAAMNATSDGSSGMFGSDKMNGFGYGIGVSVGILILITTITLASYYCARSQQPQPSLDVQVLPPNHQPMPDVEAGLDEATLLSYPKLLYSKVKQQKKDSTASCCSICLADYKDSDMLRLLPDCGHLFHLRCVDAWLRMHPTCPVCRTSPIPSPLPTPLAEVVPLASARV